MHTHAPLFSCLTSPLLSLLPYYFSFTLVYLPFPFNTMQVHLSPPPYSCLPLTCPTTYPLPILPIHLFPFPEPPSPHFIYPILLTYSIYPVFPTCSISFPSLPIPSPSPPYLFHLPYPLPYFYLNPLYLPCSLIPFVYSPLLLPSLILVSYPLHLFPSPILFHPPFLLSSVISHCACVRLLACVCMRASFLFVSVFLCL